jgi:hypothetical protein
MTGIIKSVVLEGNTYVIFNTSLDEFFFIKNWKGTGIKGEN